MALAPLDDTIAAIATAPGVGAIGVVRVSGPEALVVAEAIFRPVGGGRASQVADRVATFGRLLDGEAFLDDALLLAFRGPRSYTGQDVVELQLHGGPAVLRAALDAALRAGARPAGPGEFTLRAFVHGKLDLARAEAVGAMIEARTDAARRQASLGLAGSLAKALGEAQTHLTSAYAHVVAALDYPEEGVPDADVAAHVAEARERLARLLATARAGRFAVHGARMALVGRPNAGKSSLLNALLGYERALVGAAPGTTRDYLEAPLELGRVSVTAIDTAGLRATDDDVEAGGVARARALAAAADVVVALVDGARPLEPEDRALLAELEPARTVWVATKGDLVHAWPDDALGVPLLRLSSLDGVGLDDLKDRLEARLLGDAAGEETWVSSERHVDALRDAIAALDRLPNVPHDLQGLDLETALRALDRITGRGDVVETTLSEVFERFCVGK